VEDCGRGRRKAGEWGGGGGVRAGGGGEGGGGGGGGGGGNRKLSQDEGGFQYTIRAHCGYVIFMLCFKYHQIGVMGVADSLYHVLYDDSCNK